MIRTYRLYYTLPKANQLRYF